MDYRVVYFWPHVRKWLTVMKPEIDYPITHNIIFIISSLSSLLLIAEVKSCQCAKLAWNTLPYTCFTQCDSHLKSIGANF